jgi:hypothetical protein
MNREQIVSSVVTTWDSLSEHLSKVHPVTLIAISVTGTYVILRITNWRKRSDRPITKRIGGYLFSTFRQLPWVQRKIAKEMAPAIRDIQHSIHQCDPQRIFIKEIPQNPFDLNVILEKAMEYERMNTHFDVDKGRVSGAVYTDRAADHLTVLGEVITACSFCLMNGS